MNKETQTFLQWSTLLLEWIDPDEISLSLDLLSQLYHRGYSAAESGQIIRDSIYSP